MNEIETAAARPRGLSTFLREHRDEIARELESQVATLPRTVSLSPALIDVIVDVLDDVTAGRQSKLDGRVIEQHVLERLRAGLDLAYVAREMSSLRDVMLRRCEHVATASEQRLLNRAVDVVLTATIERHVAARERSLRALDRLSAESLESDSIEELLQRFASAFTEGAPSVDTTGVLLREHDQLRLCASVGLEEDVQRGFTQQIGVGFAGRIASQKRSMLLSGAATDPIVECPGIRRRGVRALYGAPLIQGRRVLGVVYMGSTSATDFSEYDRQLFESMAARATAALRHQMLRAIAERRARELRESEARARVAHEALRVEEERLRLAAQIAELGLWDWNLASGTMEWSPRAKAILGLAPDASVDEATFVAMLVEEDRATHAELVRRSIAGDTGGLFAHDHRITRPETGEARWIACRARVYVDERGRPHRMMGAILDITDQKRTELRARALAQAGELLASSLDYRATLAHVAEMVVPQLADACLVDVLGDRHTLSDQVAIAHRDPDGAAIVRRVRERFGPAEELLEVVLRREPVLVSHVSAERLRRAARDEEHLALLTRLGVDSVIVVPLTVRDEAFGALTLLCAGSGRHFTEHDLELAEELARMASTAIENARLHEATSRAVHLRDRILALVSHDLRTPLTAIDLSGAVLLELPQVKGDPFLHKQLEVIRRNAARMSRLIGDLLDMSSIQAGRLTLEMRSCALSTLLRDCVESQLSIAKEKGVLLRTEIELALADAALCDRDRIYQVLANLLGNAIKFCDPGGVVTLRAQDRDGEALISVIDTGPGIAAEDLGHVFELFWKGKIGAHRGTGLGLFIARGIVEAHHGRMWVESRPGGGSCFSFTLPLSSGDAGEP